jgi:hypothetical protein
MAHFQVSVPRFFIDGNGWQCAFLLITVHDTFTIANHFSQGYCGCAIPKIQRETFRVALALEIFVGEDLSL